MYKLREQSALEVDLATSATENDQSLYRVLSNYPLPTSWHSARLEDLTLKVQDGTHFSPKSQRGPFRYLTSKNIRFGYLDIGDCGWISQEEHREIFRRCDVAKGDVLLTKDGANTGNATLNSLDEPL
jgi:type I restriction enzyme, S subunit